VDKLLTRNPLLLIALTVSGNPMTTENNIPRYNKVLLIFATVYTLITIYFIYDIKRDESASLGYLFIFPVFWMIAGILLGLLFWLTKIKLRTVSDKIALALSTPVPLFIFVFAWSLLPYSQSPAMTNEFNKDGHRYREVKYQFTNGQTKRVEFYKSQDIVTDEEPFPKNDIWLKDSIWIFYNKEGKIETTEDHRSK